MESEGERDIHIVLIEIPAAWVEGFGIVLKGQQHDTEGRLVVWLLPA